MGRLAPALRFLACAALAAAAASAGAQTSVCGPQQGVGAQPRPVKPTQADTSSASACTQAQEQLLAAENDDAFERAYRRVRLLCGE